MSSSRPQSVLRCHEEVLMESPCTSTPKMAGQTQQSKYALFASKANELSKERKRLNGIRLQAQQEEEECLIIGGMRATAGVLGARRALMQNNNGVAEGRSSGGTPSTDSTNQQHETPKNGTKVLSSIDINLPTTGPRFGQQTDPQQLQPIVAPQSVRSTSAQNVGQISMAQQQTRKRRAEELGEERLNMKERVWVCADVDRAIHLDGRTLTALLIAEKGVAVSAAQVQREQSPQGHGGEQGVDEKSRQRVVEWLDEVCVAEHADSVVLPLTVAFLDRMLASKFVPLSNVQALASACLLLASKMRAPQPIMAPSLSEHTDYSVQMEELLDWEMIVLGHLQWNLLQSTPFEFFDQLLVRCPVLEALREEFALTLHRMQRVLSLATQFPSVQAAACLLFVAVRSKKPHLINQSEQVIQRNFVGVDPARLYEPPFFADIASALGSDGTTTSSIVADAQRHALTLREAARLEQLERQKGAIKPPNAKRMSLGEKRPQVLVQQKLTQSFIVGRTKASTATEVRCSSSGSSRVPPLPSAAAPLQQSSAPSSATSPSPPEDDASRSSSSSSADSGSSEGKVYNDSGFQSHASESSPRKSDAHLLTQLLHRDKKDYGQLWPCGK